ncbi:MAG: AmmeMemoRadiSam system radical SAM enzyme [Thermoleophilia bacterium]|nr:AmmeMemoRadiSam system radical SAM enzyme [Thermoleophilia bacterium]
MAETFKEEVREGMLYEKRPKGKVKCRVCPRLCVIAEGKMGICKTRKNIGGKCYTMTYGKVVSVAVDPIEKKPLFHFHPGTKVLSLGSLGCNMRCIHCQNWQIAHAGADEGGDQLRTLAPEKLPGISKQNDCAGVAWTYNEPTIWLEYCLDGAKVCHEEGLYTVFVTNGYITMEALDVIAPHLDAYRVDIKGFRAETYKFLAKISEVKPMFEAAAAAKKKYGCHVEIVTNVIPTVNDDEETLRNIASWIAGELGVKTPWHVTRFHPYLELSHLPATPIETLERAIDIGHQEGLKFVYIGNVPGHEAENTICPNCRRLVVRRDGYIIEKSMVREGYCAYCGEELNIIQAMADEES